MLNTFSESKKLHLQTPDQRETVFVQFLYRALENQTYQFSLFFFMLKCFYKMLILNLKDEG